MMRNVLLGAGVIILIAADTRALANAYQETLDNIQNSMSEAKSIYEKLEEDCSKIRDIFDKHGPALKRFYFEDPELKSTYEKCSPPDDPATRYAERASSSLATQIADHFSWPEKRREDIKRGIELYIKGFQPATSDVSSSNQAGNYNYSATETPPTWICSSDMTDCWTDDTDAVWFIAVGIVGSAIAQDEWGRNNDITKFFRKPLGGPCSFVRNPLGKGC